MHLALSCENYLRRWFNHHEYMRLSMYDYLNVFHRKYVSLGKDAKINAHVNPCGRQQLRFVSWAGFLHACEATRSDRLSPISNAAVLWIPLVALARCFVLTRRHLLC